MITNTWNLFPCRIVIGWVLAERKRYCKSQRILILDFGGDKSFADDLNIEQGAVSSRVALLLRSAEAKPMFSRFVSFQRSAVGRSCFEVVVFWKDF